MCTCVGPSRPLEGLIQSSIYRRLGRRPHTQPVPVTDGEQQAPDEPRQVHRPLSQRCPRPLPKGAHGAHLNPRARPGRKGYTRTATKHPEIGEKSFCSTTIRQPSTQAAFESLPLKDSHFMYKDVLINTTLGGLFVRLCTFYTQSFSSERSSRDPEPAGCHQSPRLAPSALARLRRAASERSVRRDALSFQRPPVLVQILRLLLKKCSRATKSFPKTA